MSVTTGKRPITIIVTLTCLAMLALTTVAGSTSAASLPTPTAANSEWSTAVLRLNAGGPAYTDSAGNAWQSDQQYVVGGNPYSVTNAIAGTTNQQLYQSERWGNFVYNFSVPNGVYDIRMHFAEINPDSGTRVFNVIDQNSGSALLSNLNISNDVGNYTAEVKDSVVTVTNGTIHLGFQAVSNDPKISGIELLKPTATSVFQMNTGGPAFTDSSGLTWQADQYATTEGGSYAVTTSIANAGILQNLYQSEHWGMSAYNIPLANGSYRVRLYFAEINPGSGQRVMSVKSGSTTLVSNLDLTAKVGDYTADIEEAPVTVTNGTLNLSFSATMNSPKISGIQAFQMLGTSAGSTTTTSAPGATTTTTRSPATTTTVRPTTTTTRPPATTTTTAPATPSMSGWTLVTSDDFSTTYNNSDGSQVDESKWWTYNNTAGNEGVGLREATQDQVRNGELQIVGQGNTAGGMMMAHAQTYGRYVFRARMDKGSGYGPAILLWPSSENWPTDGEIDMTEMPEGARNVSHFTLHWGANNAQDGHDVPGDFSQWHTWTVDWQPDHISFWIDGVAQWTETNQAAIPHGNMNLAIQNDVGAAGHWIPGPDSSTPSQVDLHVDYVQVYK